MKLIVGLGNPGKEYEDTRHNVGWGVVEQVARLPGFQGMLFKVEPKFKGRLLTGVIGEIKVTLLKPTTFMNSSGEAVAAVANFYKIAPNDILLIHDDLDIPLGSVSLQFGRGPKIHNGIISVEEKLGTKEFFRMRIGINNRLFVGANQDSPQSRAIRESPLQGSGSESGEDYVLGKFSREEQEIINKNTPQFLSKIEGWLTN